VAHTHTHHHGADAPEPKVPLPVARWLALAVALIALLAVVGLVAFWPSGDPPVESEAFGFTDLADGTVRSAGVEPCSYDPSTDCNVATVEVTSGPGAGAEATLEFSDDSGVPAARLEAGDDIVLNDLGPAAPPEIRYTFADFQRRSPMLALAFLFAAIVLVVARLRGLLSLVGLVVSLAVVLGFVLPALVRGSSPVGVALTGAAVIALAVLYLAHGWHVRTTVALLGTMSSLVLIVVISTVFASLAQLTGLASEESVNLLAFAPDLDFRGLLLAAIIIGSLGVLDDVTVTQVSAVTELQVARPSITYRELYGQAVRIGRDHIASATNTLFLAYTAAALPLLMLFTQSGLPLGRVLTTETVAVEVVQALVGSIGLVASVPITTALAAWVLTRTPERRRPAS
jgi:uncharacterized membrane protein